MANDASEALERLRRILGQKRAELWLKGATVRIDDGHTVVVVSNPFQRSGLETHCVELIDSLFGGQGWSVEIVERAVVPRRRQLCAGPGNNLALKLVRAFVEGGPRAPELLVLFGAPHTGKSLLADWAAALGKRDVFRLDLARLRRGASRRLTPRKKLVVADGVEALAGAEGSQRVLCRIMDEVRDRGGRFMLTLQGHPHAVGLTSALRNRLLGGVAIELDLPRPPARSRATLARLLDVAAGAFRVDRAQLESSSRRRGVVEARRTVMSVAVRGGFPRESVASALGLKSERSVREGCRWVERQKERDPRFAALVHEVERVLPSK